MYGENILKIREALGLSQLDFVEVLGAKSKSVVSNVEREESYPRKIHFAKLQRRFGFTEEALTSRILTLDEIEEAIEKYKKPQEATDITLDDLKNRVEQLEASYKNLLLEVASIPGKRLTAPDDEVLERIKEKVEIDLVALDGK